MTRANPIPASKSPVPRLPSHVIVYKVPASPFWWIRFYAKSKKYVIRSSKSKDKRVAFALARDLFIQDLADPKGERPLNPKTFKAVAESLLSSEEATGKASLYRKDRSQLENFVYQFFGNKLLGEITHHDLNDILIKLREKKRAPQTKKHYLNVIRKVFKHGVELGVIDALPLFPKIGDKLITQQKRDYFTMGEYSTLSKTISRLASEHAEFRGNRITLEYKYLANFMINSFIRPSDLRVLKHKHVVRREEINNKTRVKTEWLTLRHPATKTTALEVQTMPSAVEYYDGLRQLRREELAAGLTSSAFIDPDDYVFMPQFENRETAMVTLGRIFGYIIEQSGLDKKTGKRFTLYSLRHTAIMYRLMNSEVDSIGLAKNARTSQAVIERFYGAHLTTEQARRKLHSWVEGKEPPLAKRAKRSSKAAKSGDSDGPQHS